MGEFHEVRFPCDISLDASGKLMRKTDIVELVSGHEERNQRWVNSRRIYNVGLGVRTLPKLSKVLDFFEERRGAFYGFRFKDFLDYNSSNDALPINVQDQLIGIGDGTTKAFQIIKRYGVNFNPYTKIIHKIVDGTLVVGLNGIVTSNYTVDINTGIITFNTPPSNNIVVSCGYEYDVPCRFNSDDLDYNLAGFEHGEAPNIEIIELRL